jgi:hypothetical protein
MAKKATKKVSDKVKLLLFDLQSKDNAVVLKALSKARSIGTEKVISQLVNLMVHGGTEKIKAAAKSILLELKLSSAVEPLIKELKNPKVKDARDVIISVFWSAGLDASHHVDVFVKIAIEGTYMECLECLTVIENLHPPFQEELINDSLLMLKDYFADGADEKEELMKSITTIIKEIDRSI